MFTALSLETEIAQILTCRVACMPQCLTMLITDTEEPSCLLSYKKNPDCQFFTYYSSRDLNYPALCFLQRELSGSLTACEHCKTGISDCSDITDDICSFSVGSDDTPLTSFMFTESGTNTTVTISDLGMLLCELNIVAVGGGGRGSYFSGGYNGGGSGYVSSINVPLPFPQLTVRVGGPGEKSTIGTPDQLLLSASPGGKPGERGGDGYSGGGYNSDGGEDGGDGYGSMGGKGSGLDLSSITLQSFSITPGEGGKALGQRGGGGGGVLANGVGPNRNNTNSGEGYGGGRGYESSDTDGPGLVLMEIIRRK